MVAGRSWNKLSRKALVPRHRDPTLIIVFGNNHGTCSVNIGVSILALGFGNFGGPDVFIILLIVLVLFGAKKLPDLARSLGQSMNEFKKAREDIGRELHGAGESSSNSSNSSDKPVQGTTRSGV